jgi:hypothetical protein
VTDRCVIRFPSALRLPATDPKKDIKYSTYKWLDEMKSQLKKQLSDFDSTR